ncbi:MAG: zinc-ribbon domain-containing protein [Mariprofundaceae bacterium]|nr:zinc-ribbon domain-containing protein [Mariprofundaceae bacterium]
MEYIQCQHCHKKYRVNEQVRAAAGRMVKCKDCGEAIEIVIFQSLQDDVPMPEASQEKKHDGEQVEPSQVPESSTEKKERGGHSSHEIVEKDKNKKKITLSVMLGVLIVSASIYGFFQGRSQQADDLHQLVSTKHATQIETKTETEPLALSTQGDEDQDITDIPENHGVSYSQACKEAAAQQWLTDFSMSHGKKQSRDYLALLDQGIQTSALIRQYCGGFKVVTEVLQTAQNGVPPEWLLHTVNEMTQGDSINTPRF